MDQIGLLLRYDSTEAWDEAHVHVPPDRDGANPDAPLASLFSERTPGRRCKDRVHSEVPEGSTEIEHLDRPAVQMPPRLHVENLHGNPCPGPGTGDACSARTDFAAATTCSTSRPAMQE